MQEDEPFVEYCPGLHFKQVVYFSKEYVPPGHNLHSDDFLVEKVPALHGVHCWDPRKE